MKKQHLIAATLLGLAIGVPVASSMAARSAQQNAKVADIPAQEPRRKASFSLQAVLDQRDPHPAIKSARDFTGFRRAAASREGSPFRNNPLDQAVLADLPLSELIVLLEEGELRDLDQINAAFKRLLEADPLGAWEKFQELPFSQRAGGAAGNTIFDHWAKHEPERMLGMLEKLPESESKALHANSFILAWGKADPAQALHFLDRLIGLGSSGLGPAKIGENLLAAWMEKDQEAASRWVDTLPPGETKNAFEEAMVMAHLGKMSPDQAVQWILAHPDRTAAQKRLPNILWEWAYNQPAAAVLRLAEFPENHPFWAEGAVKVSRQAMTTATISNDADSFVATVNKLPEGSAKRKLLQGMIQSSVEGDAAADSELNSHRPGSMQRAQALKASELAMAIRLLDILPESQEREEAAAHFAGFFRRGNAAAIGEWIKGQEPSASRDAATEHFAAAYTGLEPVLAAGWADSLDDPAQAAAARQAVHASWHKRDPQAADQWRGSWPQAAVDGR